MPEMPASEQTRQRLFEQALLLVVRQHGAAPDAAAGAARELAAWRKRDPAHESACQAALAAWQRTDARMLRDEFALPASPSERKRQTRRRLTALLGFAGLALLTGHLWQEPSFTLRASTGQARIETHELPDGSRLDLAPRSEVAMAYRRDRRQANLLAGEVRFDVAPDSQRPFEIETRHGRVRALGTAFSVRILEDGLRVAVAHGRVAVWRAGRSPEALPDSELGAGDALLVSTTGELRHSHVAPDEIGAWRQGWLVFDGVPLAQAVERWNDYQVTPLVMEGRSELANMRLTGSFPINKPQAFLEALPRTHPVDIVTQGNGSFLIRQRSTAARNEK